MIFFLLMASIVIAPVAEAVLNMDSKTPIGSVLRSADWAQVPIDLRNRAQFSAGVESARVLNRIQTGLEDILSQTRNEFGVLTDRSGLIAQIGRLATEEGLTPTDPSLIGGLQDITSERRAELIYQTQTESAYGYANWKDGQDPDALDAYPAQELVRVRDSKVPRDWVARWAKAASASGDSAALNAFLQSGRMVALKSSKIWQVLSRFGNPWPPFDFNSGMGVEDVARGEAEDLQLLSAGATVQPSEGEFNQTLEASVTDLSPEMRQNLQSLFGNQVDIDAETVKWKGNADDFTAFTADIRANAESVFAGSSGALGAVGPADVGAQGVGGLEAPPFFRENIDRWSAEISAVGNGRKPLFHEDLSNLSTGDLETAAQEIQSHLPQGVVARFEGGHLYVYNPDLISRLADTGPLWPQVVANRENGAWLGYGSPSILNPRDARVLIFNPYGEVVSGFHAPRDTAQLYAAARVKDFVDATGRAYWAEVLLP